MSEKAKRNHTSWVTVERGIRKYEHLTRKHRMRPDIYYALRYKVDGKSYEEGLGWASEGWTLEKARTTLAELRIAKKTGTGPITLKEKRSNAKQERDIKEQEAQLSLQHIFDNGYMSAQLTKSQSAINSEKRLMRLHITPFFGNTPLQAINPKMMDDFLSQLMEKKSERTGKALSAATIRYTFAVIRQVWNYALSRDLTKVPYPAKRVKAPVVDNRRMRFLTRDEADRLLEALEKRSQDLHDQSLLSLFCGLRAGEIFKLEWSDINFEEGFLHVRDRKNKESGIAWLTSRVKVMLERRAINNTDSPLVFPSRIGNVRDETSKVFPKAVAEIGLNDGVTDHRDKVVFHTLRHTFASWLAQKGVPLHTLAGLMGHKTTIMTQRYAHLSPEGMKAAAMLLDKE